MKNANPGAPVLTVLLRLAWPIVLARATQSVVGFCDALMVAPLGEAELAAVTTGALDTFTVTILPFGAVAIVQSFVSQLRGQSELGAVRRYAHYGFIIAAFAALLCVPAIVWLEPLLSLLGLEPRVESLLGQYMAIRLLSVGPAVAVEVLGNWYGGLGNTRPAMVAGVVTMVANIVLNYALIEPHWGLPGYGVAGAAAASSFASVIGFLSVLVPFALGWGAPARPPRLGLQWAEFLRMLRFGVPNGVNWFLEFSAFILFINVMVAHLGTTALAAFNVVLQFNSVAFMPAFGLASAGAILTGEAIGRRALEEVPGVVRRTALVAAAWMGSVGLAYFLFPGWLMQRFAPGSADGEALLRVGVPMLMLSTFWQIFDAVGITLSEALRAAGDTLWCMLVRIALAWGAFVPAGWWLILRRGGGVEVVMALVIAYIAVLAVLLTGRFWLGRWRSMDLVPNASH